jgi:hypothetical protein
MWRSKKFLLVTVLAVVLLAGSIGGVALAQTGTDDSQLKAQDNVLLDKVCAIYEQNTGVAINSEELEKAFDQARSEMQDEALDNYLKNLVDQGKLTQEQADQYKAWLESKPDVPLAPGLSGNDMHRGFGGPGGGFPGWCGPQPTE